MPKYLSQFIPLPLLLILVFDLCPDSVLSQSYTSGLSVTDSTGYVEYLPGNLPIVISVPHGGYLQPLDIPRRDCSGCVYNRDLYTQELARSIIDDFYNTTGCYPHVVINLLHRNRFDANRSIETAADGDPIVEQAWHAYHAFIETAKTQIISDYDRGLFLDLHGHGHEIQRVELGYRISRSELQQTDTQLNSNSLIAGSAIQTLVGDNLRSLTHAELLRGAYSLGTLLENKGIPAVPSKPDPFPAGIESYFSGGYNTGKHSSETGGPIDGIQIECHQGIRFDELAREMFADSLTKSINEYIDLHYHDQYLDKFCALITDTAENRGKSTIELYPNPTAGFLNLSTDFDEVEVHLYNYLGQPINTFQWRGLPLDLQFLQAGYYLVVLRRGKELLGTQALIKK